MLLQHQTLLPQLLRPHTSVCKSVSCPWQGLGSGVSYLKIQREFWFLKIHQKNFSVVRKLLLHRLLQTETKEYVGNVADVRAGVFRSTLKKNTCCFLRNIKLVCVESCAEEVSCLWSFPLKRPLCPPPWLFWPFVYLLCTDTVMSLFLFTTDSTNSDSAKSKVMSPYAVTPNSYLCRNMEKIVTSFLF